jgi:signal transduction histidine kinase
VPVELGSLPAGRLPAAVETTAYFVVAEALINACTHGRCLHAEIGVRLAEDAAIVQIRDDGVGGADPSGGSGLRGLADRVSTLGGELDVESPSGGGIAITARLPLAAYAADPVAVLAEHEHRTTGR